MAQATAQVPKNRPADSAFKQQRLTAWQPILTPVSVISIFSLIGIVFVPLGAILLGISNNVKEMKITYDAPKQVLEDMGEKWCTDNCSTAFQRVKVGEKKIITFHLDKEWEMPVYVYYQLDNFYQNHRRYVKSRSDDQLRGKNPKVTYSDGNIAELDDSIESQEKMFTKLGEDLSPLVSAYSSTCDPLILPPGLSSGCKGGTNESGIPCKVLWPCGLIAGSFFDDFYSPVGVPGWSEKDIAWESDKEIKFQNPKWFKDDVSRGDQSLYYHLHQRYPHFPELNETGVENEHFIVWMRTAGLPTFRKLYAKIGKEGEKLKGEVQIEVNSHFDVSKFDGSKSLVLSQTSWLGGKNPFLGIAYIVVGSLSLLLGIVFLAMHLKHPRKLGDTTYLVFKEN